MKKALTGYDNFKELIEKGIYYVDKTKAIEEILENPNKVMLFPRPRRFGKSLFVSMLDNFFNIDRKEDNKDLFEGLYIKHSKYYKDFGEYPVIKLDFKELKESKYENFFNAFRNLISMIYEQKSYVKDVLSDFEIEIFESIRTQKCEYDKLKLSVKYLSDWLCRYYKKQVVILIDEYDAPISNAYITDIYEDVMNLIKGVFSACLKGNDSLKFGVLTGVLRVSRESMFSDLNNVDIYDLTHKGYSEYFGFTGEETKELLEYFGLELTDEVKGYYDGYNFGGISIYNPWSILNYASKKELVPYWVNTSGNLLIRRCLIDIDSRGKELIEKLLLGEAVAFIYNDRLTYKDFDKTSDVDIVLNLLLISGYLTFDKKINDDGVTYNYFRIPNKEVKEELINIIKSISIDGNIEKYVEFKKNLINGEKELVEKYINEILVNMSYYDKKENFYHGYMLGLFTGFLNDYYKVRSNRESGDGRYDLLIEKKDLSVGMIFEFKITDNDYLMEKLADDAMRQIDDKKYMQELICDNVKIIHKYVIVFCGKKCIVR